MMIPELVHIETDRLYLRQWQKSDFAEFAKLNADEDVMRHFPNCLSTEDSDHLANKIMQLISENGWGFWAVSLKSSHNDHIVAKDFIGFVGLHTPSSALPCSPCIEIGWRLHKEYWGQGYATEAANEALRYAFDTLDLDEVVSFTTTSNLPSLAVMQRIGMTNTKQDFLHPALPPSHPMARLVLYKITQAQWRQSPSNGYVSLKRYYEFCSSKNIKP